MVLEKEPTPGTVRGMLVVTLVAHTKVEQEEDAAVPVGVRDDTDGGKGVDMTVWVVLPVS